MKKKKFPQKPWSAATMVAGSWGDRSEEKNPSAAKRKAAALYREESLPTKPELWFCLEKTAGEGQWDTWWRTWLPAGPRARRSSPICAHSWLHKSQMPPVCRQQHLRAQPKWLLGGTLKIPSLCFLTSYGIASKSIYGCCCIQISALLNAHLHEAGVGDKYLTGDEPQKGGRESARETGITDHLLSQWPFLLHCWDNTRAFCLERRQLTVAVTLHKYLFLD